MYPQPSLRRVASVLLLSGVLASVHAQIPFMKVDGKESNLVYLQQLNVDVRIHGTVAVTTWTMTFRNSTGRTLEGELNFPLAEGVSVARYALDINGRLREAVPVEKEKGTMVFENIERRRVDPGLLEKVEGNGFRTRIYPIAPHGIRTVLIGYEEELSAGASSSLRWRLPLAFTRPLEVFNLNIQVLRGAVRPVIEDNIDKEFQFQEWENNWTASRRWEHFKADRSFTIVVPKQTDERDVMMQQEGNHYLYLLSAFPLSKKIEKPLPRRITLLWDASLSGLTRDHQKELQLLDAYFSRLKEVEVTLVPFNYTVQTTRSYAIHNGGWQLLREALEHTVYDGATQFGVLHPEAYPGDEYLLFSDGRSNYGSDRIQAPPRPLYAIVATANTDFPYLRDLTERSGGELINLETGTIEEAKTQLLYQRLYFMGIRSDRRLEENYPSQPVPVVHGISVAGISYEAAHTVVLQFGYGGKVVSETKVSLDYARQKTSDLDLSRIWAQKKLTELDKRYEDNKSEIQLLGRRYGLVTRNTSLIVLETVEDYVTYNIEPPAELREEYDRIIKSGGQTDRLRLEATKDRATDIFNQLLTWWNTKFTPVKPVFKPDGRTDTVHGVVVGQRRAMANGYVGPLLQGRAAGLQVNRSQRQEEVRDMQLEDAVDKKVAWKDRPAGSSGEFRAFHHEAQTVYLSRLKKTPAGDQYAVYLQERKSRMYTPVFYFNTAQFFFKQGKKELGLQILSNIAELDIESYELYKMLGYELRKLGETGAACAVFRKVLDWRPFEPQSYRDYGLALRDAGYYQRALDTLYTALVNNYDASIGALYPGIEETILPEINHLVAMEGGRIDAGRIPKSLLQHMPVDIRVVLNWNMSDTDIDLWVTDPDNEKCYYSHKETALGGRISSDFTRGLGPEQFMLKKAAKGRYKVEVNYFGDTQAKLAGPTTILVEIYTHYGMAGETRKLIPLQMQSSDEKTVLVGEFTFE